MAGDGEFYSKCSSETHGAPFLMREDVKREQFEVEKLPFAPMTFVHLGIEAGPSGLRNVWCASLGEEYG